MYTEPMPYILAEFQEDTKHLLICTEIRIAGDAMPYFKTLSTRLVTARIEVTAITS